ncbi:MAG: accessory factor UbiK family protein [Hydrogenovibrio sp.]|uniref:accessory factor UbiK family protein n=1 Tax=Hydrogenovibrio sp. TaxID=2065821 RepID=UPI00287050D1|nr:accessory factor UbiK family protein [Hydrogenovibrio sp.]MDR9498375.1 accessory factor UbiK family protein [Hydrogenovibrio sp.]
MMSKTPSMEALVQRVLAALPEQAGALPESLKPHLQAVLSQQLSHLDCVSRETFDQQTQVLLKTRMKLEALEKQVAELEASLESSV